MKSNASPKFKIALAQIKSFPGQIELNKKNIIKSIQQAKAAGAELVVFPELTIPGYCSLDLFFNTEYLKENRAALEEIISSTNGIAAVVGFVDVNLESRRAGERPCLYNSAAVISDGSLVLVQDKTLLPSYSIFQEERYFVTARKRQVIEISGRKVGVQICEDLWSESYQQDPTQELINLGAQIIVNLSASPFEIGKFSQRCEVIRESARKHSTPILYSNLVGCYDGYEGEIIFDGRSLVVCADGSILGQAEAFQEDLLICDLQSTPAASLTSVLPLEAELFAALCLGITDYFERLSVIAGMSSPKAIIGVSGGIDSAVVLALAVAALGKDRVIAVNMPSQFNASEGIEDSFALCASFGLSCETIAISKICSVFEQELSVAALATGKSELASENIQARTRMIILMYYANSMGGLVLNTGNKTELALDNCTIYGDMVGGFSVLGDLDKDRVYLLADYINHKFGRPVIPQRIIDRVPTAELKPNQIDADVMGADPRVIAPLVREILEKNLNQSEAIVQLGLEFDPALIAKVFAKLERSEWKRRQAAPAIRVTSQAFGVGRRIPILHGFRKVSSSGASPIIYDLNNLRNLGITRLGLFGGTFDPPHLGHLKAAELAFRELGLSHLLLMPAGQNPLKEQQPFGSDQARLEMLSLMFEGRPGYLISDWEMAETKRSAEPSYTYNTLVELRRILGDDLKLYLIIGTDVYAQFHKFYRVSDICELCKLVVIERRPFLVEDHHYRAEFRLFDADVPEVSSTELRQILEQQPERARALLDPRIADYLGVKPSK